VRDSLGRSPRPPLQQQLPLQQSTVERPRAEDVAGMAAGPGATAGGLRHGLRVLG